MKKMLKRGLAVMSAMLMVTGCAQKNVSNAENTVSDNDNNEKVTVSVSGNKTYEDAVTIELSDGSVTVDGKADTMSADSPVYVANDIVFYLEDQGFKYGEGEAADEHSREEADAHSVVHITQAGTYVISGKLSAGQIAVDLGEDAKENPEETVTLILNGADITCTVAPAVIFYNVYECGSDDVEMADKDVDTSAAGANVIIADGSVNNINGSYVARIYKSYELNAEGTEVVDNKKLHKYDGAFYSKMSMNVNGDEKGTGVLNIVAENEGLDSEMHLTINGGNINIFSGNDGINTNEDEVSVTTVNGGNLNITVTGETGEGDGIDSNGWLVINGGLVTVQACSNSGDAGIDSDMGIHINGGTVIATGNMLDRISESESNYAVFSFESRQNGGNIYSMKNESGDVMFEFEPENDFTYLVVASENLEPGKYTLWQGENKLAGSIGGEMMGGFPVGPQMPDGEMPSMPDGEFPKKEMPGGERPSMPDGGFFGGEFPEGVEPSFDQRPDREAFKGNGRGDEESVRVMEFEIVEGGNYFNNVGNE